jgi:hypothetical protein
LAKSSLLRDFNTSSTVSTSQTEHWTPKKDTQQKLYSFPLNEILPYLLALKRRIFFTSIEKHRFISAPHGNFTSKPAPLPAGG